MLLLIPLAGQAFGNAEINVLVVVATGPKFMFYFLNLLVLRGNFFLQPFFPPEEEQ